MFKIINLIKKIKAYFAFSFLLVIFLSSSWTLFKPGFFRTHDYVHAARIAEMTRALQDGHFPVRWSENFGFGLGMPLFEFYAPLPFFVGSIFYYLGFNLVTAIKILFFITNLFSLIGAYKLGKSLFGIRAGILVSAAFTLAPYRAVNLFIRGALSEAWGMMALPWILYGIVKIAKNNDRQGWLIFVLGLVTMMLSHNLTTLMFVPFSLIFALGILFFDAKNRHQLKAKIIKLAGGYLLAGGLSSFYMLPAFLENKLTQIETILGGYFHYSLHFLYIRQFFTPNWGFGGSAWGPNDDISFFLGWGQIIGLFIALLAFIFLAKKAGLFNRKESWRQFITLKLGETKLYFFLLIGTLLGASLWMTLLKTKFIWDNLPLFNFIQFPWRFLAVSIIFLSLLVGLGVKMIPHIVLRFVYFVVIFWIMILGNFYYFRPEKYLADATGFYYGNEEKIALNMSDILRDYVPIQMSADGEKLKKIHQNFALPTGTEILIDKTQAKLYKFKFDQGQVIEFPVANFPGWQAEINGQKTEVLMGKTGLVAVNIPVGESQVGIYFGHTPVRLIADTISAVSLLIFLYFVFIPQERTSGILKKIS